MKPYKGLLRTLPLQGSGKVRQPHFIPMPPLKGFYVRSCLLFLVLFSCKRIHSLKQTHLVARNILLQLVTDILLNPLLILSYSINIVPSAPKVPVTILVLQVCVSVKYHQTALSFQVTHYLCNTLLRRYRQKHMNMVGTRFCFYYFNTLLFT